jgi:hypothetical protein
MIQRARLLEGRPGSPIKARATDAMSAFLVSPQRRGGFPTGSLGLLVLGSVLFHTTPAFAGKGDEFAAAMFMPTLVAAVIYLPGLALHMLILAYAPRRGSSLVSKLQNHKVKTLILGVLNTLLLTLIAFTLAKPAPVASILAVVLWYTLAVIGSHGIARGLGRRILGREHTEPPGDLKEIALGWFVFLFALAIPGLGLILGFYWSVRATGGVVLTLFSIPSDAEEAEAAKGLNDLDRPGDINELLAP